MQTIPAHQWISAAAERLHRRWRTVDPAQLEALAADLWGDERLRALDPEEAADVWLAPVNAEASGTLF